MSNPKPISQARDADLRGSWPALLRAAARARVIAEQTGTKLIVSPRPDLASSLPQPGQAAQVQQMPPQVPETSAPYAPCAPLDRGSKG